MEHARLQLMDWRRRVLAMYAAARAGGDLGTDGGGRLVLDFNDAYSYDPQWSCPLAPPENRLDVAVEAGEGTARWYEGAVSVPAPS